MECVQSVREPDRCSRKHPALAETCDGSHHIHTVYMQLRLTYMASTIFSGQTHIAADTHRAQKHTHRHKQSQPCGDMTIANEAWQGASLQTSWPALPVWLSGLHYPHQPPSYVWKEKMIACTFSPTTSLFSSGRTEKETPSCMPSFVSLRGFN